MILKKIINAFPESNRTQEQDLLIGSSCLALTDIERHTMENLNFNTYLSSLNNKKIRDLSLWSLAVLTPLATAASGAARTVTEAIIGHSFREKIGYKRDVGDGTYSHKYILWSNQKYKKIIFPALSRYIDPIQWEKVQLECPITLDWMVEPVQAEDGHFYEKEALLAHLVAWEERIQQEESERRIPIEEMIELLQTRSPLRKGIITIAGLKEFPDYYEKIFKDLKEQYNDKVLDQQFIVDRAKTRSPPFPKEVSKVVRFYEKTQKERSVIATNMHAVLLRSSTLSDEEIQEANQFLHAAAELPKLIK